MLMIITILDKKGKKLMSQNHTKLIDATQNDL